MSILQDRLAGRRSTDHDLAQMEAVLVPKLSEAEARSILSELNAIIAVVEHEVLVPAEQGLADDDLVEVKRLIGQV